MTIQYGKVIEAKQSAFMGNFRNYMTVGGYTKLAGAPTNWMVKISCSNRWLRVMNICRSNSGTLFVKTKSNSFIVINDWDLG